MVYATYRDLCRDHNEYLETFLMKKSFWDLPLGEQLALAAVGIEKSKAREDEYHKELKGISDLSPEEQEGYIRWTRTL